jgi:hypothetical protein
MELNLAILNRRNFVRRTAFAAALYACPFRVVTNPGGQQLFTDRTTLTGPMTNSEITTRSNGRWAALK